MSSSAGIVLAGGRSSRMGTPKAALEWHDSTLLRRTAGIMARVTGGPVVVVRAPGRPCPTCRRRWMSSTTRGRDWAPVQGLAAGLAATAGRAEIAFVCSTDLPFLHPAFVRRVLRAVGDGPPRFSPETSDLEVPRWSTGPDPRRRRRAPGSAIASRRAGHVT